MLTEITATSAAPVRRAARLKKRAFRYADGRFLAEGPQAIREALGAPGVVSAVFATGEAGRRHPELRQSAAEQEVSWQQCSGAVIDHLAGTVTPQGMVAVCQLPQHSLTDVLAREPRLIVVLASVRDPGNAGTVIRVADAAGADAVVLSHGSVDPFNPKAVRASAGSIFHLPVVIGAPMTETSGALRSAGLTVLATDASGRALPELADSGVLGQRTAWVFGNEAAGVSDEVLALADVCAGIPIYGSAESLNLATAAAVCLYASATAQRQPGGVRSTPPGEQT